MIIFRSLDLETILSFIYSLLIHCYYHHQHFVTIYLLNINNFFGRDSSGYHKYIHSLSLPFDHIIITIQFILITKIMTMDRFSSSSSSPYSSWLNKVEAKHYEHSIWQRTWQPYRKIHLNTKGFPFIKNDGYYELLYNFSIVCFI